MAAFSVLLQLPGTQLLLIGTADVTCAAEHSNLQQTRRHKLALPDKHHCAADVRLIGHWGEFMDAALAFAAQVPERFLFDSSATNSTSGETQRMSGKQRAAFRHMQIMLGYDDVQGLLPDYLVFDGINRSELLVLQNCALCDSLVCTTYTWLAQCRLRHAMTRCSARRRTMSVLTATTGA